MARLAPRLGVSRFEADEYYKKALAAYNKRNIEEALINVTQAIEALPNNAEYYAARGLIYIEDGIEDKARADFEQALKIFPYEMLAHYGQGILAFNAKNWDDALAHFTAAYRVEPKRPETLYYLALVYHRKGQNDAAQQVMAMAQDQFDTTDAVNGKANEKRRADANRWVKTFEKLVNG